MLQVLVFIVKLLNLKFRWGLLLCLFLLLFLLFLLLCERKVPSYSRARSLTKESWCFLSHIGLCWLWWLQWYRSEAKVQIRWIMPFIGTRLGYLRQFLARRWYWVNPLNLSKMLRFYTSNSQLQYLFKVFSLEKKLGFNPNSSKIIEYPRLKGLVWAWEVGWFILFCLVTTKS